MAPTLVSTLLDTGHYFRLKMHEMDDGLRPIPVGHVPMFGLLQNARNIVEKHSQARRFVGGNHDLAEPKRRDFGFGFPVIVLSVS